MLTGVLIGNKFMSSLTKLAFYFGSLFLIKKTFYEKSESVENQRKICIKSDLNNVAETTRIFWHFATPSESPRNVTYSTFINELI